MGTFYLNINVYKKYFRHYVIKGTYFNLCHITDNGHGFVFTRYITAQFLILFLFNPSTQLIKQASFLIFLLF